MQNFARQFALTQVKLPDLGEGTKEATVKEMFVKVGSKVLSSKICAKCSQIN